MTCTKHKKVRADRQPGRRGRSTPGCTQTDVALSRRSARYRQYCKVPNLVTAGLQQGNALHHARYTRPETQIARSWTILGAELKTIKPFHLPPRISAPRTLTDTLSDHLDAMPGTHQLPVRKLGSDGLVSSQQGIGCMGMSVRASTARLSAHY